MARSHRSAACRRRCRLSPRPPVTVISGPQARDASSWMDYIRASTVGVHHPSSSCRMGRDSFAVVDPMLRVHGVDNLMIADASVFPRVVAGNTNAAVVMVAEKAADLIGAT